MSLFSIKKKQHTPGLCPNAYIQSPWSNTHSGRLACFCRARNPITFETTPVAPNNSPAGCLIALTTGIDTEAASYSTVRVVDSFHSGLENAFPHHLVKSLRFISCCLSRSQNSHLDSGKQAGWIPTLEMLQFDPNRKSHPCGVIEKETTFFVKWRNFTWTNVCRCT